MKDSPSKPSVEGSPPTNFVKRIIEEDIETQKWGGRVATRFPPEPNGYLHIGHAKAICLNFSMAEQFQGTCNLRFDDTNPGVEDEEYVRAIIEDIQWLGFDWGDRLFHASDYFQLLYESAVQLIQMGKAFVCDLNTEQMREYRGTLTEPGKESPFRNRSVEENLELFEQMRQGAFEEGSHVLRAKIDMASGNINLRDPVIYRIRKIAHQRTGTKWCIYPMYDFAHCVSDSTEGITHSLCSLEFEDHRPLYDWFLKELKVKCHSQQIEFARLNLNYVVTSKRKVKALVDEKRVDGWDDPRLPTLRGLRRRGYTPRSIRNFCERIGVTKKETTIDYSLLEDQLRNDLNENAPRAMGILNPLKVVISDYPEGKTESLEAPNHPQNSEMGSRKIPFSRELYIECEDFLEDPPKKYFRLAPGREVRLRYAYVIRCDEVIKDEKGEVIELRCSHDPATLGKKPEGRKVKGIIHWLSVPDAVPCEMRLYDRLFLKENPDAGDEDFKTHLNPDSIQVKRGFVEPNLSHAKSEQAYQFERLAYFCVDSKDSKPGALVFNRTVGLRDTWAKIKD